MGFRYDKLFVIAREKGLNKTKLRALANISTATLAKLSKNENVDMEVLGRLCAVLHCQPGDLVSFEPLPKENPLLTLLKKEQGDGAAGGRDLSKQAGGEACSLYQETQVLFACHSSRMEGIPCEEAQVRTLFFAYEGDAVCHCDAMRMKETVSVANHFEAFRYLLYVAEDDISDRMVQNLFCILAGALCWQWMHTEKNDSARMEPLRQLLGEYCQKQEKQLADLVWFFQAFDKLRLFPVENGRIGRILLFKECLRYRMLPVLMKETCKDAYFEGLRTYADNPEGLSMVCKKGQLTYRKLLIEHKKNNLVTDFDSFS